MGYPELQVVKRNMKPPKKAKHEQICPMQKISLSQFSFLKSCCVITERHSEKVAHANFKASSSYHQLSPYSLTIKISRFNQDNIHLLSSPWGKVVYTLFGKDSSVQLSFVIVRKQSK